MSKRQIAMLIVAAALIFAAAFAAMVLAIDAEHTPARGVMDQAR